MHDHVRSVGKNASSEPSSVGVFDAGEFGAAQSASWRVHVDAEDVSELCVLLEQGGRQRTKFAADTHDEESLFSHESQITERQSAGEPHYAMQSGALDECWC